MFHSIVLVEILSRDSDSGGYGVTLLGTKTSSCEGLRGFEERLRGEYWQTGSRILKSHTFMHEPPMDLVKVRVNTFLINY